MTVVFLEATLNDLSEIISLLMDDDLGSARENNSSLAPYISAFNEISTDPNNELIVGKIEERVVAVLQLTYIPNLTLRGCKRVQIEGVRVASSVRGQGIGRKIFEFALDRAKAKGCKLAQLTTNKARVEAFRFYESLSFKATHEGFKLIL